MLSEIYNFDIVDSELQDDKENKTTFLIVKRG
jgi:prephenate dehydratase